MSIELIKDKLWYKVSKYIRYLLGEYSGYLEKEILKIISENQDKEKYLCILNICNILNVSTEGWKIFEKIIENASENDTEILNEIDCMIFNTGSCCGEYGIVNSFKEKETFFKSLKSKNQKVKKFIEEEKERYNYMYLDEKKDVDKKIIYKNVENQITKRYEKK